MAKKLTQTAKKVASRPKSCFLWFPPCPGLTVPLLTGSAPLATRHEQGGAPPFFDRRRLHQLADQLTRYSQMGALKKQDSGRLATFLAV